MKREDDDGFETPLFSQSKRLAVLEEQLYGHVRSAIDLDALSQLEQHLSMVLGDQFGMTMDLSLDLSTQMLESAIRRVAGDPQRHVNMGPPDGITDDERFAVAFDETCQFCLAAKQNRDRDTARAKAGVEMEDEYCACCEMLRDEWRDKHAEVLAKAGLARPSAAAAIAGAIAIAKRDHARRDKPS
jgi:hypothetical protein